MLASLLPGLRDLRTPLATGYLWVVALWLVLHDWVPGSVEAATGPIKSLYQLGTFGGDAVTLAALSFIAYLLGSMLRIQPRTNFSGTIYKTRPEIRLMPTRALLSWIAWQSFNFSSALYRQLETFVSTRLRETASDLNFNDHVDVVLRRARGKPIWPNEEGPFGPRPESESPQDEERVLTSAYAENIVDDFPAVAIQLQAKNRDFWDTYDRQLAEAQFRYGIAPPLALIIVLLAWQSGDWWWLFLLAAPVFLFVLGYRHRIEAASTLVQAVVLKMVEPPVLERLRETVAKKQEEEERTRPRTATVKKARSGPSGSYPH